MKAELMHLNRNINQPLPPLSIKAFIVGFLVLVYSCDDVSSNHNIEHDMDAHNVGISSSADMSTTTTSDAGITDAQADVDFASDGSQSGSDGGVIEPLAYVFATSEVLSGDTMQDVDEVCRRLALASGLDGAWKGWRSTRFRDALELEIGNGPWYRTDKVMAFPDHVSLADGPIVPINLDESGNTATGLVFTGTSPAGRTTGDTCREWKSYYDEDDITLGDTEATGDNWTSARVTTCGLSRRAYCFQDTSDSFNSDLSLVSQWNELLLAAIRNDNYGVTITSRQLFIVSAAMYDAWSLFAEDAQGYVVSRDQKADPIARTVDNQEAAVSYAAYYALVDQFPEYEAASGRFETLLNRLGYEIDDQTLSAELGRLATDAVVDYRRDDGANESSDFRESVSDTYPNRYRSRNSANPRHENAFGQPGFDPNHWVPLRVPTGVELDDAGYPTIIHTDTRTYNEQTFLTPHWGAVEPFALVTPDQFRPAPPPRFGSEESYTDALGNTLTNDQAYRAQFAALIELSRDITEEQKVAAEFWADGPRTESPPGHWNQIAHGISTRDRHSVGQDVRMYFALNAALLDAGIACWDSKRRYDFVRPISAIRFLYGDQVLESWMGPNQGVGQISGAQWLPYQDARFVTPAFAEYVSGHSAFSYAAARILTLFTGGDVFYDGITRTVEDIDQDGQVDLLGQFIQLPGKSQFETISDTPVVLFWPTFTDAAEQASLSRRWGGIHIQDGDLNGRQMGINSADQAFFLAQRLWVGPSE